MKVKSLFLFMALLPCIASAGQDADSALPEILAAQQRNGNLEVVKSFKAAAGLDGYLVKQNGHYGIVYGHDGYVLLGKLIGPDGTDMTEAYKDKFAPKPDYADVVKKLEQGGHLVTLGKKGMPLLYVFEDANCYYCYKLNQQLIPLIKDGKVQVKVAMVAFLKPSSLGRATAIMSADDPAASLEQDAEKFDVDNEEGGYPAQSTPDAKLTTVVQQHDKLMQAAGFSGTPGILYKDSDGKWNGVGGMPTPEGLKQIIGIE